MSVGKLMEGELNTFGRRAAIRGSFAGASLLTLGLPLWDRVEAAPFRTAPKSFVAVSAACLGIAQEKLLSPFGSEDLSLADIFYDLSVLAGGDAIQSLLVFHDQQAKEGKSSEEIGLLCLSASGKARKDAIGVYARLVSLVWLYGVWYGGKECTENTAATACITNAAYRRDLVVSSRAYKEAWIWRIAQAHPMGYSHFNFGSWAEDPPSLVDYGIVI